MSIRLAFRSPAIIPAPSKTPRASLQRPRYPACPRRCIDRRRRAFYGRRSSSLPLRDSSTHHVADSTPAQIVEQRFFIAGIDASLVEAGSGKRLRDRRRRLRCEKVSSLDRQASAGSSCARFSPSHLDDKRTIVRSAGARFGRVVGHSYKAEPRNQAGGPERR